MRRVLQILTIILLLTATLSTASFADGNPTPQCEPSQPHCDLG